MAHLSSFFLFCSFPLFQIFRPASEFPHSVGPEAGKVTFALVNTPHCERAVLQRSQQSKTCCCRLRGFSCAARAHWCLRSVIPETLQTYAGRCDAWRGVFFLPVDGNDLNVRMICPHAKHEKNHQMISGCHICLFRKAPPLAILHM